MSREHLTGKAAIVTGGSKGKMLLVSVKATVLGLAEAGASIIINYASNASAANALVEQIGNAKALAIKADAGNVSEIEKMIKQTIDRFGKIDIVIPNAGMLLLRDLENTTEQDFDTIFALNAKGPYFLIQKAVPHMSCGSHVVLVSTSLCSASTATPNYLLYLATKGAIEQMTRGLSKDLARKGISVNAVARGPTATELFIRGKLEPLLKQVASLMPQNRLGTPEEVADAIVLLSGEKSRWITGQIINVNGGMA